MGMLVFNKGGGRCKPRVDYSSSFKPKPRPKVIMRPKKAKKPLTGAKGFG